MLCSGAVPLSPSERRGRYGNKGLCRRSGDMFLALGQASYELVLDRRRYPPNESIRIQSNSANRYALSDVCGVT